MHSSCRVVSSAVHSFSCESSVILNCWTTSWLILSDVLTRRKLDAKWRILIVVHDSRAAKLFPIKTNGARSSCCHIPRASIRSMQSAAASFGSSSAASAPGRMDRMESNTWFTWPIHGVKLAAAMIARSSFSRRLRRSAVVASHIVPINVRTVPTEPTQAPQSDLVKSYDRPTNINPTANPKASGAPSR